MKTPKLSGSILDGVTRNSVCRIASDLLELQVEETDVYLKDVLEADEVFCSGTAVSVTPVGRIIFEDKVFEINQGQMGSVTEKCKETLKAIQREEMDDPFGWIIPVAK